MMDLVIKNCKFVDKEGEYNIAVKDGKIAEISKLNIEADKEIDAKTNYVLPGFIDPHVHFRDPGLTKKEDFKTGSEAAAAGGFTTVIDMPNTIPKTNTYKAFKEKLEIANKKCIINFKLQAGVNTLEEMKKIMKLEPASFKIFMDLEDDETLEKIFKDLAILKNETNYNGLVTAHCEKQSIILDNMEKYKDSTEPIAYSYVRNSLSEEESVKQAINLSSKNNLKLHICHLSSKKALKMAKEANVSYEFTPHHLLLNNDYYNKLGTIIKTNPPLREEKDKISISDIDETTIIGTDHAPHTLEEKHKGVFNSSPGISNIETVVPLLLTEVNKNNIDLKLIPKILSENVAKVFNLKTKGKIAIGYDADFTIIDLKKEGKFNIDSFKTKGKYSPFDGWEYQGKSIMTIVNGKIIVKD